MTTTETITKVGKYLTELGLPDVLTMLPPGHPDIPQKGAEKHPGEPLLKFERELTAKEGDARNKLQQRLSGMTVTNYGVFFKKNGKAPIEASGEVVDAAKTDPVYEKSNGKAQTTFPVKSEMRGVFIQNETLIQTFTKAQDSREAADQELQKYRNAKWRVLDITVELVPATQGAVLEYSRVITLERVNVTDPQPQPQPSGAAEIAAPEARTVHVPDAIIEPEKKPEPVETPLDAVMADVRHGHVDLWLAQKAAEREIIKRNAVMGTYNFLRQQTLQHVVFGGG